MRQSATFAEWEKTAVASASRASTNEIGPDDAVLIATLMTLRYVRMHLVIVVIVLAAEISLGLWISFQLASNSP